MFTAFTPQQLTGVAHRVTAGDMALLRRIIHPVAAPLQPLKYPPSDVAVALLLHELRGHAVMLNSSQVSIIMAAVVHDLAAWAAVGEAIENADTKLSSWLLVIVNNRYFTCSGKAGFLNLSDGSLAAMDRNEPRQLAITIDMAAVCIAACTEKHKHGSYRHPVTQAADNSPGEVAQP